MANKFKSYRDKLGIRISDIVTVLLCCGMALYFHNVTKYNSLEERQILLINLFKADYDRKRAN